MLKTLLVLSAMVAATPTYGADQPSVQVEPSNLQGPRLLEAQTRNAVIRDYLQAWQTLGAALQQNNLELLGSSFVGNAKDKLAETIQQQASLGLSTRYKDRSHDLQIVFYSPEGLSIELQDKVEYDVQVLDHDKVQTTKRVSARYVVVMSPAEVRWRVRVFQAQSE